MNVTCDQCGNAMSVPDDKAGKRGKCPKCSAVFTVPTLSVPIADAPTETIWDSLASFGGMLLLCVLSFILLSSAIQTQFGPPDQRSNAFAMVVFCIGLLVLQRLYWINSELEAIRKRA